MSETVVHSKRSRSRSPEPRCKRGVCTECRNEDDFQLRRCQSCLKRQGCALAYDDKCRQQTAAVRGWCRLDGTSQIACSRCYAKRQRRINKANKATEARHAWLQGVCTECRNEDDLQLRRCQSCLLRQGCALAYDDKCRQQTAAVTCWRHLDGTSQIVCNRLFDAFLPDQTRCYARRRRQIRKASTASKADETFAARRAWLLGLRSQRERDAISALGALSMLARDPAPSPAPSSAIVRRGAFVAIGYGVGAQSSAAPPYARPRAHSDPYSAGPRASGCTLPRCPRSPM